MIKSKKTEVNLLHNVIQEGSKEMPSVDGLIRASEFFKAFSDPTRLKILYVLLSEKLMDVGGIAHRLQMSDSAISHQLKLLKQQRLVAFERSGKNVFYRLDDDHIGTVLSMASEHVSESV